MRKTEILTDCDGCGATEAELDVPITTHTISLDNVTYEIDLCPECLSVERQHMQAGRLKPRKRPENYRPVAKRIETRTIRAWANRNGHNLNPHGRIPNDVRAEWITAGSPRVDNLMA